jgi:hypothetical protein
MIHEKDATKPSNSESARAVRKARKKKDDPVTRFEGLFVVQYRLYDAMIPSPGMAECYHFLISHIYENFIKFAYC